jgi:hypothetical protein
MQRAGTHFEQLPKDEVDRIVAEQIGRQNDPSATPDSWEKRMDISNPGIFELLEQNAKWWEHAAVACENLALRLASGEKEEWLLLCAVYRERADLNARRIEDLRQKSECADA